jgi:response regulator of citrate/malate metabolism
MIYNKVMGFMQKSGKKFSADSLSKRLGLNYETTRKYLRTGYYVGQVGRVWTNHGKKSCYRYYAI